MLSASCSSEKSAEKQEALPQHLAVLGDSFGSVAFPSDAHDAMRYYFDFLFVGSNNRDWPPKKAAVQLKVSHGFTIADGYGQLWP